MPAFVSVILPTYNRAAVLPEAIDSVLAQSYGGLEVLVIDDGSTDGTRALVDDRYGDDERVRYHQQANAGVAAARNKGIELSRGDFIAFIDSDDQWKPWKLELQLRCLDLVPDAGMLWTDMEAIGPDGQSIAVAFLTTYYRAYRYFTPETLFSRSIPLCEVSEDLPMDAADRNLYVGDVFSQMIMGNLAHTPTVILRRKRFEKVGWFNESLRGGGEDFDFLLRTCREGPVAYADVSSIHYRVGMPDSLSRPENNVSIAENYLAAIEPILECDRDRIALPAAMISAARAWGHLSLGRNLLLCGSPRGARVHLAQAWRLDRRQVEALVLAPLAYAPPAVGVPLARAIRTIKRRLWDAARGSSGVYRRP